jgi:hypothetical protein
MILSRGMRRCAALAAAFGIALQALWPVIAQARPADSISVPICSIDGTRHEIELPIGKTQDGSEHCKLCVLGDEKPFVVSGIALFVFKNLAVQNPETSTAPFHPQALIPTRSRAPPQAS